ncbi:pleckstrin homology domain-containing family G member 4B-like [Arapaima gigas]
MEQLGSFNRERIGTTLDPCLSLSKNRDVFCMPWETLVCPEFVSKMTMIRGSSPSCTARGDATGRDIGPLVSTKVVQLGDDWTNRGCQGSQKQDNNRQAKLDQMTDILDHTMDNLDHLKDNLNNQGEHAEVDGIILPRFSPQKGSLTQFISQNYKKQKEQRTSGEDLSKTAELHLKSSTCTLIIDCTKLDKENPNDSLSTPPCFPVSLMPSVTNSTGEALTLKNYKLGDVEGVSAHNTSNVSASERSSCAAPTAVGLLSQTEMDTWQLDWPGALVQSTGSLVSHETSITATKECEEATTVDRGGPELPQGLSCIAVSQVMTLEPVPACGTSQQEEGTQAGVTGVQGQTESYCAPVSCGEQQALPQTGLPPSVDVFPAFGRESRDHVKSSVTGAERRPPSFSDPSAGGGDLVPGQCQVTTTMKAEDGLAGLQVCHTKWQCQEMEADSMTVVGPEEVPGSSLTGETCEAGSVKEGQGRCCMEACSVNQPSVASSTSRQFGDGRDEVRTTQSGIVTAGTQPAGACDSSPLRSGSCCAEQQMQQEQVGFGELSEGTGTTPSSAREGERRPENGFMGEAQVQRLVELTKDAETVTADGSSSEDLDSSSKSHLKESWQRDNEHLPVGNGEDRGMAGDDETLMWKSHVLPFSCPASSETQPTLAEAHNINSEVLNSGVLCLPGTRDKCGRALVILTTRNTVWLNPNCNSSELVRILIYFYNIIRKEVRSLGLTVLVDSRRCSPVPALFKAFHILQETVPRCIHTVLLLADRDPTLRVEKSPTIQFELLTSLKSLHKHVDTNQLPTEFDGTFPFCHSSWIGFRMRLEQLTSTCQDAIRLLKSSISKLESAVLPATAEEAQVLLCSYKNQMNNILEDNRLLRLQLEGGAVLSRLRKEESSVSLTEDYRDAIEMVSALYDQVDELLHHLVTLSNKSTQQLEFILDFTSLEEGFAEVRGWIEDVGESQLMVLNNLEDSLEQLHKQKALFRDFYAVACERCSSGEALLQNLERWEAVATELQEYRDKVCTFWTQLRDFSQRVEDLRDKLDKTVRLYEFFDKAYKWALEGMRHLAGISTEDCSLPEKCHTAIKCLEGYHQQHPEIPDSMFQDMKDLALELKNDTGLKQWTFAWSKCQETKKMFKKKLAMALQTHRSLPLEGNRQTSSGEAMPRLRTGSSVYRQPQAWANSLSCKDLKPVPKEKERQATTSQTVSISPAGRSLNTRNSQIHRSISTDLTCMAPCTHNTQSNSLQSAGVLCTEECPRRTLMNAQARSYFPSNSSSQPALRPGHRVLRKARSFDVSTIADVPWNGTYHRMLSEPARHGNTGVFIKGLEVSSTEVADRSYSPRLLARTWVDTKALRFSIPTREARVKGSKLHHIVDEMVTTEREYVKSLHYVIEQYFPEMERPDLPQDLRGKRSVIFGNLEKLVDFHSQFFLKELESCCNHPLRVSHCFLRHKDQFGLYALYSKNKPKSDALLATHGNAFFRNKQLELEDKMDLASYLLKPIQRMSKYALLLKDLIKEVSEAQEQELNYLRAAAEMVKFQLRHGNDLLAMDAIRDCDVNLKEQGQLVRQDEFTIFCGRKRCQRHIFLFEDLVLFSKPKRIEGGLDVYIYKHSFKTADIGMTETSGDNGLRFEVWFRRRTSKSQTYILQARTSELKQAWTSDIARILWQQATRNKEIRMQEMVSMGVGNKPFLDIKPSDAAINDRAIDYFMKGRGARTRASIAVSLFDHSNPFSRTQVTIPVVGGPPVSRASSSSLLGSLNLHMYSHRTPKSGEQSFVGTCIEEDEQEHETSSQPSMTTESSESSSHCVSASGSSGSDSGCASGNLPEGLSEGSGSPCDTSLTSMFHWDQTKPLVHLPACESCQLVFSLVPSCSRCEEMLSRRHVKCLCLFFSPAHVIVDRHQIRRCHALLKPLQIIYKL